MVKPADSPRLVERLGSSWLLLLTSLILLLVSSGCGQAVEPAPTLAPLAPTPVVRVTRPATIQAAPTISPAPTQTVEPVRLPQEALPPARALTLAERWQFAAQDIVWDLALVSLDGGEWLDVAAGSYDGQLHALDVNGNEYWRAQLEGPVRVLTGADLDGNGIEEVIAGGDDNRLTAIEEGSKRWSFSLGERLTALEAAHLSGGSEPEIIAATAGGRLLALSPSGELLWQLVIDSVGVTALKTADLSLSGVPEIVAVTESGRIAVVYAQGSLAWEAELGANIREFALADLSRDGMPDIAVGTAAGELIILSGAGVELWRWQNGGTILSVMAADINGDGAVELVDGSGPRPGRARAWAGDGHLLWESDVGGGVWALAAGDLDGDGRVEIAAGSDDGRITILAGDGRKLGSFQTGSGVHGLAIADVDHADGSDRPQLIARSAERIHFFDAIPGESAAEAQNTTDALGHPADELGLALAESPGEISLIVAGDVMLSRGVAERSRMYGPHYPFAGVASQLQGADVAAVDLESVLTITGEPAAKSTLFRDRSRSADGLMEAGVDVVFLANGHALDFGLDALFETMVALDERGIAHTGAGRSLAEATAPAIVDVDGVRLAFLAFTDAAPESWYATESMPGIAQAEIAVMVGAISRAKRQADHVIVAVNGPRDFRIDISPSEALRARAAIDAGASLVIGNGAGVRRRTERYGEGFIIHGLGDFVYDASGPNDEHGGAILRTILDARNVRSADLLFTEIVNHSQPRLLVNSDGSPVTEAEVLSSPDLSGSASNSQVAIAGDLPHYDLSVDLDYDNHRAGVEQTVTLTNDSPDNWTEVVFNASLAHWPGAFVLRTVEVTLEDQPHAVDPVREGTMIRVELSRMLNPGEPISIRMEYVLDLPALDPSGWGPDGNAGYGAQLLQMGDWYPTLVPYLAGDDWQTWHYHPVGDPVRSELADYDVTISAPAGVVLAAPGFVKTTGGERLYHLERARAFAFLASPEFVRLQGSAGITPIQVYVLESHQSEGQAVMDAVKQSIALFEDTFGPYPYRELVVAENGFLTAMEYSALISLSGFAFDTYNGGHDSLLESITAHEVAHQWWYGAVGNDQVYEPWLDEGLSMYSELLYYQKYHPNLVNWWWYFRVDRWNPAGPVNASIYDYRDSPTFVHNVYGRAAHFMDELRATLGDRAFLTFLGDYYRQNRDRFATEESFFDAIRGLSDADLEPLMGSYFQ